MDNNVLIEFGAKLSNLIAELKQVSGLLDNVDEKEDKLQKKDTFKGTSESAKAYNRVLLDNSKVYQTLENSAKSYEKELERLKKIQSDLIRQKAQFSNSKEYDRLTGDLTAVNGRISEISSALQTFNGGVNNSTSLLSRFAGFAKGAIGAVGALFIADAALDIEGQIFDVTAKYEAYRATLQNATQDEIATAEAMEMVANVAIKSNFTVDELTGSYIKLVNRGIIPTREELIKQGDIAASQGKGFDQLTEAILDAMTNEYERLKEFGIKARTIGDTVSFTFKGITKEVKKMDEEGIKNAILSFGDLQGVAGAMSATSTTLNGQLSAMSDNWEQILKNLGEGQSGIFHATVTFLADMVGWLKEATSIPFDKKLRDEKIELNSLVNSIIASNENSAVRSKLMTELINKYPSILRYIDAESASNGQLLNALKLINAEYERKIRLAARSKLADNALQNATDSQLKVEEGFKTIFDETGGKGSNKAGFERLLKQQGQSLDGFLTATSKKQREILLKVQAQLDKDNGIFSKINATQFGRAFKDLIEGLDESAKAQTEYNKVLVDNEKINDNFAKQDKARIDAEQAKIDYLKKNKAINGELYSEIRNNLELQSKQLASEISQTSATKQNAEVLKQKNAQLQQYNKELKEMAKNSDSGVLPESVRKRAINDIEKPLQGYKNSLAGVPAVPKADKPNIATTPNAGASNAEKELQREQQRLLKLQEDYKEKLASLELDSENVRLSLLDKKSQEYIDKKKEYDLKLVDAEREKFKELYNIQAGQVLQNGKDDKGNPEFKLFTRKEVLVKSGKSELEAELELEKEFAEKSVEVTELLNLKKDVIRKGADKETINLQRETAKILLNLQGESLSKELAQLEQKYAELYEANKSNGAVSQAYFEQYLIDREGLRKKYADNEIETERKLAEDSVDLLKKDKGERQEDFEKRVAKARLDVKIEFAQKAIESEIAYQTAMLELARIGGRELTDEEKKNFDNRLQLLKNASAKAKGELNNLNETTSEKFKEYSSIWDLTFKTLGVKFSDNPELNDAITGKFTKAMGMVGDGLKQMLDAESQASKDRLDSYEEDLNRKNDLLNQEIEKEKQGLANSANEKRAEVEKTKKLRDEEKEHYKKVQKEKAAIESLEMASATALTIVNMIASASQTIKDWSKVPFVGVAIGIASAISLIATFASIRGKFKAVNRLRKGKRLTAGRSHENGGMDVVDSQTGEPLYNIEKNEWLMGSEPSEKHNDLLGHINNDSLRRLPFSEQRKLLAPLGVVMHNNAVTHTDKAIRESKYVMESKERVLMNDYHYKKLILTMEAVKENTEILKDEKLEYMENGKFARVKQGKIVGIKEEPNY
jgi:hypothetical protein